MLRLRPYCPSCVALVHVDDDVADAPNVCPVCGCALELKALADFDQDARAANRGRMGTRGWMAMVSRASIRRRSH